MKYRRSNKYKKQKNHKNQKKSKKKIKELRKNQYGGVFRELTSTSHSNIEVTTFQDFINMVQLSDNLKNGTMLIGVD
jgi:FtsZ-interacting cell division protein YlmF